MMHWNLNMGGETKRGFILRITSVLYIFFIAATTQAQSLIPELSFKNPVLKTGKGCTGDGLDGAVYIFENVGWGMDALITILGRSSALVTLSSADIQGPEQNTGGGTGYDNAWQPAIKYANGSAPPHQSWWMEFKISFVQHSDQNASISVNQFFVTGLDIDGDGKQLHEFQSYYKMHSYSLEQETAIFASSVQGSETDPLLKGKRFDGPVKNYEGISVSAQDAMVSNYYTGSSTLIVRLGAETAESGSNQSNRKYGLLFKSLAYDVPVTKKIPAGLIASNQSGQPKE
jgi:hypothetical protein